MKRKAKLPFDPKVFLSKVDGGRATSDYRKDQIVYRQGDPADSVFYIRNGKVKATVVSEQGKEAVVALLGADDFFGEGCLAGQPLRLSTASAMAQCVIVRIAKADITRVIQRRAGVCRVIYLAPLGPQQSCRGGPGRSTVQFERETPSTDTSASGEFWQGRSAGAGHSENQPRDTGGDNRHDTLAREFFHEQISGIGSY
jgi:hypothetical protein